MVTGYQVDPKTGAIMLLLSPEELEVILILVMRGLDPKSLETDLPQKILKGLELVYENCGPRRK